MPAPLLRKKPTAQLDTFDPASAALWAAGASATAAVISVIELLAFSHAHKQHAQALSAQVEAATALTPCAVNKVARTQPRKQWNFNEYVLAVRACEALRAVVVDGCDCVPRGEFDLFDSTRETAAAAVLTFVEQLEAYAKLVKRERAMERLSGTESLRRGLTR